MSVKRRLALLAASILLSAWTVASGQIQPREVLVVANANSPDSRNLAELYCRLRQIPKQNLLLVETTTDYQVSRRDFDVQILRPIRARLATDGNNGRIRCLALVYGVPVRVAGPVAPTGKTAATYRRMLNQMQDRAAMLHALLDRVASQLPSTIPGAEIDELQKLFGPLPEVQSRPMSQIRQTLPERIQAARQRIAKLVPPFRDQAGKQLEAILYQLYGIEGLIRLAREGDRDVPGQLTRSAASLAEQIAENYAPAADANHARKHLVARMQLDGLIRAYHHALTTLSAQPGDQADASVDSELALARIDTYQLAKWVPNPLHYSLAKSDKPAPPVLMTARLDGPGAADVRRMIRNSVQVEKKGLSGRFYIDAGGLPRARAYDANFRKLFSYLVAETRLTVRMDDQKAVFGRNACPDAALYVGWYSLRKYVPAFLWKDGAVGWHVSSFEAQDLRNAKSSTWCVKMIQNGVAATVGAVNEPYLAAFPLPQDFFALLLTGQYSLAECYWWTVPHASWRITLIGDPLYRPFRTNPPLPLADVPKKLRR
jgi:uncharacterized protein (TIGR03790 family)